MGVDTYVLKFLLECRQRGIQFGRTLQLGRQGFYAPPHDYPIVAKLVTDAGLSADASTIYRASFTEELFRALGATRIDSIDASPYEGATLVYDLNDPIPMEVQGKYDTVFDGGSLEHIFNVPTALRSLMQIVQIGGTVLSVNGANGFLGHGFFQFSAELMYRVFCRENGFTCEAFLMPLDGNPTLRPAPDPAAKNRRLEIGVTGYPTYLMVIAKKIDAAKVFGVWPQQSDYKPLWEAARVSNSQGSPSDFHVKGQNGHR
jgi:hypothetical protein